MTIYVLCKTVVPWLCSRSQPGIKRQYKGPLGAFATYCNISCFQISFNLAGNQQRQAISIEFHYEQNQIMPLGVISPCYAPNFGEVEGAYWFGSVRPSVRLSVRNTLWPLRNSRTAHARILKLYMWHVHENKQTRIFFLHRSCRSGIMPPFRLCMNNLVNRISDEPLRLESLYLAYSYRLRCR